LDQTHFILMTDIAGSSRLAESFPREYEQVLQCHNAAIEGAVAAHGGAILKGLGDGYLALFSDAKACLACAVEVQRSVGDSASFPDAGPLRLRVVCHAGALREVQTAAGRDYFGTALNRAARICQVCHPGQLLISAPVRVFLGAAQEVSFTDLGPQHLRDLAEPEHLYQVLAEGFAVREHPQPAGLARTPNNLLPMPGSFVGRATELAELERLLAGSSRLITIVSPGGYGKSRVAAQLCANVLDRFKDGVFEVRLAALSDPAAIPAAVAGALAFQCQGERELRQQLIDFLRPKQVLLHFDNFEHLQAGADLLLDILATTLGVRIVVTSREPLHLPGEQIYRLGPLPLTTDGDAVQLFAERAQLARHHFALDESTRPKVARICHALDGVPLALELAAAWVDSFTLDELAAEMDRQLELTARVGGIAERHRSVRASCDWSWARLSEPQRALLRRCSIFAAGFYLEAAEAVLGERGLTLRQQLAELCDKGWLYVREVPWVGDMGEPVRKTRWQLRDAAAREYVGEKLRETATADGSESEYMAAARAFTQYYAALLDGAGQMLNGAGRPDGGTAQLRALRAMGAETLNLRRAIDLADSQNDAAALEPAARYLATYAYMAADYPLALELYPTLLSAAQRLEAPQLELHARLGLSNTCSRLQQTVRAAEEAERATELAQRVGGPSEHARALVCQGRVALLKRDAATARRLFSELLDLAEREGLVTYTATALNQLAFIEAGAGAHELAVRQLEAARAIFEQQGNLYGEAVVLAALGTMQQNLGDYTRARALVERSLTQRRRLDDRSGIASCLANLTFISLHWQDSKAALGHIRACLELRLQIGDRPGIAGTLWLAGMALIAGGALQAGALSLYGGLALSGMGPDLGDEQELLQQAEAELRQAVGSGRISAQALDGWCAEAESADLDALAASTMQALTQAGGLSSVAQVPVAG
jgi:predicted ATPase/class 3 adenylate cyclase